MNKNICLLSIIMVFADLSGMQGRAVSGSSDTFLTPTEIEWRNYLKNLPAEEAMTEYGISPEGYLPLNLGQKKAIRGLFANYRMPISEKMFDRTRVKAFKSPLIGYVPVLNLVIISADQLLPHSTIPDAARVYDFACIFSSLVNPDGAIKGSEEDVSRRSEKIACKVLNCSSCIETAASYVKKEGGPSILRDHTVLQDIIRKNGLQDSLCIKCRKDAHQLR